MDPKSISASAVASFGSCEAGYKASWIDRLPTEDGSAALLGTSAHNALEDFVASGEAQAGADLEVLDDHYRRHYWKLFTTDERLDEGLKMMADWHKRQRWEGVTVISTEQRQTFNLPTSRGDLPVTFIFDRLDRLDDGSIKVVDYKSQFVPLTYEQLRSTPQPQVYGMAARLLYPDAPAIWVEFDFLRHEPIAVRVEKTENRATWNYLIQVAEDIYASDGSKESINPGCQYCPRKHVCETLASAATIGYPPATLAAGEDPAGLARRRAELDNTKKAIQNMIDEIDSAMLGYMEHEGLTEFDSEGVSVSFGAQRRRHVESEVVAKIVGPEIFAKYSKLGVTNLDQMLKEEEFNPDQVLAINNQVSKRYGRASLKVKIAGPLDD